MTARYVAIAWNPTKRAYDLVVLSVVVTYVAIFHVVARLRFPGDLAITPDIVMARALGSAAFLLLVGLLSIGPLARLHPVFLPALYNRRHLGVALFAVAAAHASTVIGYYHAYGEVTSLRSLVTNDARFTPTSVPFPLFGLFALTVFGVLASTSHDFFQRLLGPGAWKWIHFLIYPAFASVCVHVVYGAQQADPGTLGALGLIGAVGQVVGLHLFAAWRGWRLEARAVPVAGGYVDAGAIDGLADGIPRKVAIPGGEDVALVRVGDRLSAIHGVCAHQGGPLTEGRVLDGCLTCPWHGYQYATHDGCAPAPFTERLPTHPLRIVDGRVHVRVVPAPLGEDVSIRLPEAS